MSLGGSRAESAEGVWQGECGGLAVAAATPAEATPTPHLAPRRIAMVGESLCVCVCLSVCACVCMPVRVVSPWYTTK